VDSYNLCLLPFFFVVHRELGSRFRAIPGYTSLVGNISLSRNIRARDLGEPPAARLVRVPWSCARWGLLGVSIFLCFGLSSPASPFSQKIVYYLHSLTHTHLISYTHTILIPN